MRYFKLAYDIFINKFLFNLLVILEIAAMLILTNTVIATYNSKKMLYEPYKEMLSHNGVVFINAGFEEGYYDDKKEIQEIYDKYNYLSYPAIIEMFKEHLRGNTEIVYTISRGLRSDEGGLISMLEGYDAINRRVNDLPGFRRVSERTKETIPRVHQDLTFFRYQ